MATNITQDTFLCWHNLSGAPPKLLNIEISVLTKDVTFEKIWALEFGVEHGRNIRICVMLALQIGSNLG